VSVFDKKYRRYEGELKGRWARIWAIATSSFKVQFKGRKLIFLLIFCNLPVLSFTLMLIFLAIFSPQLITSFFLQMFGSIDAALYAIIMTTFGQGMIFLPVVFISVFNSGVIANDRKHNSLSLYLAKPIDKIDYVLGKLITVLLTSSFVTFVPWFIFMFSFTMLSGLTGTEITNTLWIYPSALTAALIICLFMGSIVLFFSSLSDNSILAGILTVLVLFLPATIFDVIGRFFASNFIYYFSISELLIATVYLVFGKPSYMIGFTSDEFFTIDINSYAALAIVLGISLLCILGVLIRLRREEINQ
jgi:ABC-type transport system involved in multi-copper enzyme maturation permease subunit